MSEGGRYTSGRIAVANLQASIEALEHRRTEGAGFGDLLALSNLLFARGDLLGRIADHDRAERVAIEAAASQADTAASLYIRARLAARFHRFEAAANLLDGALHDGHPARQVDVERAALLQATGRYREALALRERFAKESATIQALGALASLLADMDRWAEAEISYAAALDADTGISPLPCGQLLFEWAVSAMRRGELERAESLFAELDAILPQHVPARGHRAEVALARGQLDTALALITPLIEVSDDPEYRGTLAEILAARGDEDGAASEAERAAAGYDSLLARRPVAYADHAAVFFMGIGNRPLLALALAAKNWALRDTPRSRSILARAQRCAAARDPRNVRRIA